MKLFVGVSLLVLGAAILLAGRRHQAHWLLSIFLGLVSLNFLSGALHTLTGDPRWAKFGVLTNALDPLLLLVFVTAYPYARRPRAANWVLAAAASMAVAVVTSVILRPELVLLRAGLWYDQPPMSYVAGLELGLAYGAAWILAFGSALRSPTGLLARRAAWMAGAVGITVLPRLGLLPVDLGFSVFEFLMGKPPGTLGEDIAAALLESALMALLMGGFFLLAFRAQRSSPKSHGQALRGPLRFLGAFLALFLLVRLGYDGLTIIAVSNEDLHAFLIHIQGHTFLYALRWVIFAGAIVYGMLAFELVDAGRIGDRVVPLIGAVLGAAFAFLATAVFVGQLGGGPAVLVPLSAATALGASAPSWFAARRLARTFEQIHGPNIGLERRLALYEAALESAWAAGPPSGDARRVLEDDRRTFGVSSEEARTLEHVVVRAVSGRATALREGDEPIAGLVLGKVLGEGAHGRVFAATRFPGGERVAVKELRVEHLGEHEAGQRLLVELRALERLSHPNIVHLLEVQVVQGRHLLIMEHVEGETLGDRLRRGPLRTSELRALFLELLDAIAFAHDHGVVHRDLKPANILLGRDGRPRLTDFGVARVAQDEKRLRATVSGYEELGAFAGTLAYMAPEQVGRGAVGPRTDLYALGLVLYECLSGKPALDLRGLSLYEAIGRVAQPRIRYDGVPRPWRPFFARALAPKAALRFGSASEMRRRLPKESPRAPTARDGRQRAAKPGTRAGSFRS